MRLAAGVCVLATGLFIGSAGGAIAAADPESTPAASQSQGVEPAATSATVAGSPATTSTHPKYPIRTAIQDVIKKLQALSKPAQKSVIVKSTPPTVIPDADADTPDSDEVTPAAADPAAADPNVAAADSNTTPPGTTVAPLSATELAPPSNGVAPALKAIQPVTNAVATVAGVALSVPGVLASLPTSEDPVGDVITSMQNMLISVNDAVTPLAQVPGDLYSLIVVAGMNTTPVGTVGAGSGLGLASATGTGSTPPTAPSALPVLPVSPFPGTPLLGDVTAAATLGGIATAGLSAELTLSGTAPLSTEVAAPTGALSFLEHTVRAVLAPASLTALAAFALPGIGGLLIICAAGMRLGYRQAKAAFVVRTTSISRFAKQGPLGVVRSGSLVSLHTRRPRRAGAIRPEVARAAPILERAA
jgi:hypothetical protein